MITLILLIVFAVFLTYSVHSGFKYTRMISNIFLSLVYAPSADFSPSSRGEKITILDSSDQEIEALFIEKKNSKKLVIFCHESGATKDSWERYAYFFPDLEYHVLSMDFGKKDNFGEKNSLSQWPMREDVQKLLTVIRWSKKAFEKETELVLFGVSNGADIAFAASSEEPSVKAVITDGLFSMKEIFRDYIRKWGPILVKPNLFGQNYPSWIVNIFTNLGFWYCQKQSKKKFVDVEILLRQKHAPLFMIHGEEDDYVPASHQKFLEKISKDKNILHRLVIPKAKHNQAVILGAETYRNHITNFLKTLAILILLIFSSRYSYAVTENQLANDLLQAKTAQMRTPGELRLAETLEKALTAYLSVTDYKTKFYKTEKSKGILGPREEIFIKFEKTFKIYMRWLNTEKQGVEVVYERGKRKGKLAVHKPGLLLGLAPVVLLDQNSPWIKEGSASYNIEDAGIGSFLYDFTEDVIKASGEKKLKVEYLGKTDEEGLSGDKVEVTFLETQPDSGYMAYRAQVLFDKTTGLPVKMELFDWQNQPMGIYAYKDLEINVGSDDTEFKKDINRYLLKIYLS